MSLNFIQDGLTIIKMMQRAYSVRSSGCCYSTE